MQSYVSGSSGKVCCVLGCNNSQSNTLLSKPKVHFYSFPGREWEQEKCDIWTKFVRRMNSDGSDWKPSKSSKICSAHFIGNEKSNHPTSLSFHPTVRPGYSSSYTRNSQNKKERSETEKNDGQKLSTMDLVALCDISFRKPKTMKNQKRTPPRTDFDKFDDSSVKRQKTMRNDDDEIHKRLIGSYGDVQITKMNQIELLGQYFNEIRFISDSKSPVTSNEVTKNGISKRTNSVMDLRSKVDVSTQTVDGRTKNVKFGRLLSFVSSTINGESSTQVSQSLTNDFSVETQTETIRMRATVDSGSGNDWKVCHFDGFDSVRHCESALRDLTGVSLEVFDSLLGLLPTHRHKIHEFTWENKLLLYLMKLKLNLSYNALGALFGMHETTAGRWFTQVSGFINDQ